MDSRSDFFRELPPVLVDDFAGLSPGRSVSLLMKEYLPAGGSALFPVEYIHREVEYRSPGQKDAVAHGKARLIDGGEFRDARILFSKYQRTATLRGLELEGHVKVAR